MNENQRKLCEEEIGRLTEEADLLTKARLEQEDSRC